MKDQLLKRLEKTNKLLIDLLSALSGADLGSKLPNLPSNTIGQQFWCLVGARSSYLKAIKSEGWKGFSCNLNNDDILSNSKLSSTLHATFSDIQSFINSVEKLSEIQENFLFDLLEHEIQHHGQLIRYMYGLKLSIPSSWKDRYSL